MERVAVACGLEGFEVEAAGSEREGGWRLGLVAGFCPSKEGADPGEKLVEAEGFDQVVIGTGVETFDAVFDATLGGEHEDGEGDVEAAEFGADGIAIEAGHHDVEEEEVGGLLAGAFEARFPVIGLDDAVAFGEEGIADGDAHGAFVFDDEDSRVGLGVVGWGGAGHARGRSGGFGISDFRSKIGDRRIGKGLDEGMEARVKFVRGGWEDRGRRWCRGWVRFGQRWCLGGPGWCDGRG